MNRDETVVELFKVVNRLLDLLQLQAAGVVFGDAEPEEPEEESELEPLVGFGLPAAGWGVEDEVIRDPERPEVGDPPEELDSVGPGAHIRLTPEQAEAYLFGRLIVSEDPSDGLDSSVWWKYVK